MRVFRQGEVLFREMEKLPEGRVRGDDPNGEIRVTGETGNAHVLTGVRVVAVGRTGGGVDQFIQTPVGGAVITHPEHPPLKLPPLMVARVERVRTLRGHAVD